MKIPLVVLDSLGSTSDEVSRRLKSGMAAPFAIAAREQTQGRGRRGHEWQSPAGNLYLSLALPGSGVTPELASTVPLQVAVLVAQWLQERFGLTVTLKWPNDILFAGKKLGGILCEGTHTGHGFGPFIVGVGLNLNAVPRDARDFAISLGEIHPVAQPLAVDDCLASLVSFFGEHWHLEGLQHGVKNFRRFAIADGSTWLRHDGGGWAEGCGIEADGGLLLRSRDEPITKIVSADHAFYWAYQAPHQHPLLVADLGNTRWKVAVFYNGAFAKPVFFAEGTYDESGFNELAPLKDFSTYKGEAGVFPVYFLSVNSAREVVFLANLGRLALRGLPLARRLVRLLLGGGYDLSRLGLDRLALMEGVLASGYDGACVVVSAGTATTIDALAPRGKHLGGWILPGLQTGLDALAKTTALPQLSAGSPGNFLGFPLNTHDAMKRGVWEPACEFIRNVAMRLGEDFPDQRVKIFVAGGYGDDLAPLIDAEFEPFLILKGAAALAVG